MNESLEELKKHYGTLPDHKIEELLSEGKDGVVEGAYELLMEEGKKRGVIKNDFVPPQKESAVTVGICNQCGKENQTLRTYYNETWCSMCRSGFGNKRMGAFILDIAFAYVGIFLYAIFYFIIYPTNSVDSASYKGGAFLIYSIFFLLKDGFQGRSIGKRALGLQVVKIKSRVPAGIGQSFMRNIPLYIPLVGLVAASSLEDESRLGEKWAGTGVVPYHPIKKEEQG